MQLSDEIRRIARAGFVLPARQSGEEEFSIAVRDLMDRAETEGISTVQRTPAFCASIQTREFLETDALEVTRVDGPESKRSTTVVVHYRFRDFSRPLAGSGDVSPLTASADPLMRLRGVLKGAMREGAAAFLRELRRDKEDEPAGDEKVA